ncbi:MAG: AEC family transporter [Defluviitaleaceae bacterium]|nr:AEC family transporter [Defluviitaleaceae bacterium]
MNELFIVFANSLVALILCIAVGYVLRRRRLLNDTHTSGIAELLVKVAMPSSVFMALMRPFTMELFWESIATFLITGVVYALGAVVGFFLAKVLKVGIDARKVWAFGVGFGNVGFMGLPVISAVFGAEGLFYVAMALAAFNLHSFTWGVWIFDKSEVDGPIKVVMRNPALAATIIGFVFFLTGFRFPAALEGGIELIAGMTSPISMILIGAILAKQRLKDSLMDIKILPPAATKLLAMPVLTWLVLRWFVPNLLMLGVIVTLMAMPVAAGTVIFAEQYKGDTTTAAKLVVVSTLLCVVTVPLISFLL